MNSCGSGLCVCLYCCIALCTMSLFILVGYLFSHLLLTRSLETQRNKTFVNLAGDVLGTAYNTKVKRLREGGVVICRLEPVFSTGDNDDNENNNNTQKLFIFHLASASDLVLPHETRRNWTGGNLFHSEPDTILEISRQPSRSSITTSTKTPTSARPWMTVWRSQPILNSLQPTWDRAQVDLGTLLGCQSRAMDTFRISVCMVKTDGRRKEIGFCETNVNHMIII